ncbi:MAG TPA: hypothetical protein VMV05_08105 [bacterium]|nr:hypothetical protein [bacterium]
MRSFRNNLFLLTLVVLSAFLTVLILEGSHHHGSLESNGDCSLCSWQQTGSQAPSISHAPVLLPILLVFLLFFFQPTYISYTLLFPAGRSPPNHLL